MQGKVVDLVSIAFAAERVWLGKQCLVRVYGGGWRRKLWKIWAHNVQCG